MSFPDVPKGERPKILYVASQIDQKILETLEGRGWSVKDTRLLPNKSDSDRAEGLKAFMEGIRMGSIAPIASMVRFLELEARIYGIANNKDGPSHLNANSENRGDTVESLLDFASDGK
jgi:hypothetical protein